MEQTLAHCIHYSLQNFLYDNATFMAERLYAQEKSDLAKYLLATCYYRSGKFYKVYALLKSNTYERNRYLLALAAVKMEKFREAEIALIGDNLSSNDNLENIPNGAAGLFLLGQISRKQDQLQRAKKCFEKCLSINPFLWSAYESLCEIGGNVEPEEIFGADAAGDIHMLDVDHVDGDSFLQTVKLTQQQQQDSFEAAQIQSSVSNPVKPVTLAKAFQLAKEPIQPKAPKQTTTPALALKLFRQSPSYQVDNDGIPSLEDSPGNFVLNTINLQSSPFAGKYREGYESYHNMTPQRLPMHVMKGKRKRANLSNEKAPSISKALFDDQSPIPTSSFANLNLRENGTYNQATSPSLTQGTSPSFLSGSTQDSATWLKPTSFQFANFATKELPPSAYKATNGLSFISPNTQMPSYSPSNIPIKTSNKNTQKLKPVNPIAFDSPGLTPIGKPHGLSPIQSNMKSNPIQSNPFEMPTTSIPESSNTGDIEMNEGEYLNGESMNDPHNGDNEGEYQIDHNQGDTSQFNHETRQEEENEQEKVIINGATHVLSLLRQIGKGYHLMCKFDSQEAIEEFQKLPQSQYETGYILCKVGRCYFEIVKYHQAKKIFEQVRVIEPYRTEDMEYFSTILWQLHETVQLSYLAQQLTQLDKHSPSTWCAVGNCFSLQKDHESALKFFKRAIQVSSDNWDKALAFFRNAIRIDSRHYNAWYGLGMIYFRQEKYSIAEYHFNKALSINTKNSVLYCYIGMVLRASNRYEEAEIMLKQAIHIDPSNALAKYKKAAVLVNLGKLESALEELLTLKDSLPKEPQLFFLIGKIYKRMGLLDKALYHFTLAMDFDTKSFLTRSIKQAISKLNIPDVEGGDVEATEKDTEELEELK